VELYSWAKLLFLLVVSCPAALLCGGHLSARVGAEYALLRRFSAAACCGRVAGEEVASFPEAGNLLIEFGN